MRLFLVLLQLGASLQVSLSQNACSQVPTVLHADISEESKKAEYQGGDIIRFECDFGYISGLAIRYICTTNGWEAVHRGKCSLKPCELPEETPNGHYQIIQGEEFVFGAVIQYYCNEGYQMVSRADTRTCMLDRWSNHVPICEPMKCDPPPTDGQVAVEGLPQNGEPILPDRFIRFSCEGPGKHLNGSSLLVCGRDGRWDNPFPTCEDITCKLEPMHLHLRVAGGQAANEKITVGHKLQFYCTNKYVLDGSDILTCLESGQWSAPFPTCSENCRITDVPTNVRITPYIRNGQMRKGQKLKFTCSRHGHYLRGKSEVECLDNGQWSHPFPICGEPLGCGKPPILENGDIQGSFRFEYNHNERVTYVCQNLYRMQGHSYKTCLNGEWEGDVRCLKPCTVDATAMNRNNIAFRYTYESKLYAPHDDVITFTCVRGTRQAGNMDMRQTCHDGQMDLPTCL